MSGKGREGGRVGEGELGGVGREGGREGWREGSGLLVELHYRKKAYLLK